jgi:hypothetical protein
MAINLSTLVNQTNPVQLCKAWVNFNGTLSGTIAPRASYNVSSITKNGTGDYTVNFAMAMADANYTVAGSSGNLNSSLYGVVATIYTPTTSSVRISPSTYNYIDLPLIMVQIFGN